MSNGLRVVGDINPHGHHPHRSVPSLSDEAPASALSSAYQEYQQEVVYHILRYTYLLCHLHLLMYTTGEQTQSAAREQAPYVPQPVHMALKYP